MQGFLTQTFDGNTVAEWLLAVGIAVAAVLVGKAVYWLASRIARKATGRTENTVDDFLLDTVDEPIVVVVTVLGFWLGVQTLTLPTGMRDFLWAATQAAMRLAYQLGAAVVVNRIGRVPDNTESAPWRCLCETLGSLGNYGHHVGALLAARTGTESAAHVARLLAALPD